MTRPELIPRERNQPGGGGDAAGAGPGPVSVEIGYRVAPDRQAAFRAVIAPLGATRRRHGTLAWGVFADAENPALVLESSLLAFKILVLQALYSLSDEQAEFQLRDRLSLMRFVGFGLHTPAAAIARRRRIQHGRPSTARRQRWIPLVDIKTQAEPPCPPPPPIKATESGRRPAGVAVAEHGRVLAFASRQPASPRRQWVQVGSPDCSSSRVTATAAFAERRTFCPSTPATRLKSIKW